MPRNRLPPCFALARDRRHLPWRGEKLRDLMLTAIRGTSPKTDGDSTRRREPTAQRKLLASLFERIWEHGGAIVAVKPRAPFARYFDAAETLRRRHHARGGAKGGSDGTRTRDLRRDRPAL
jgi:hypothetical protein